MKKQLLVLIASLATGIAYGVSFDYNKTKFNVPATGLKVGDTFTITNIPYAARSEQLLKDARGNTWAEKEAEEYNALTKRGTAIFKIVRIPVPALSGITPAVSSRVGFGQPGAKPQTGVITPGVTPPVPGRQFIIPPPVPGRAFEQIVPSPQKGVIRPGTKVTEKKVIEEILSSPIPGKKFVTPAPVPQKIVEKKLPKVIAHGPGAITPEVTPVTGIPGVRIPAIVVPEIPIPSRAVEVEIPPLIPNKAVKVLTENPQRTGEEKFVTAMEKKFTDAILIPDWAKAQEAINALKGVNYKDLAFFEKRLKDKQASEIENKFNNALADFNWTKAREILTEFKNKYPDRKVDGIRLANALIDAEGKLIEQKFDDALKFDKLDEAKQAIEELRRINLNTLADALSAELRIYGIKKEFETAISRKDFKRAQELADESSRLARGLGITESMLAELNKARTGVKTGLELSKEERDIQKEFEAALANRDFKKARELLGEAKRKLPASSKLSGNLEIELSNTAKADIKKRVLAQIDEYNKLKKPEFRKEALFIPEAEELKGKIQKFAKKAQERETNLSMMINQLRNAPVTEQKIRTEILNKEAMDEALADLTNLENEFRGRGASGSIELIEKSKDQIKANPLKALSLEKSNLDILLAQLVAQPGSSQVEKSKIKIGVSQLLNDLDDLASSSAQQPAISNLRSLTSEINKSIDKGNMNELDALFKSLEIEVGKIK